MLKITFNGGTHSHGQVEVAIRVHSSLRMDAMVPHS